MSQMRTQAAANAAAQASAAGESAKEVTAKAKAAAKDAAAQAQATTQDTAGKAQAKSEGVWQKVRCCDAALPALHEAVSVKAHDMRNSIRRSGLSSALSKQAWCFNAGFATCLVFLLRRWLRQVPVAAISDARHQLPSQHGLQHSRSGCSVELAPDRFDVALTMTWTGNLCCQHSLYAMSS